MKLNYRLMQLDDLNQILAIQNRVFMQASFCWMDQQFKDCLNHSELYRCFCLDFISENQSSTTVAYAVFMLIPNTSDSELLMIAVDLPYQSTAIAVNFFKYLINFLKQNTINLINLEVAESNVKAQRFYYKLGFNSVGKRKNYYKINNNQTESAVLMALNI